MDQAVLVLRVVFGLILAAHGAQKLFGWFGGYGLSGTAGFFEGLGFRPGRLFALAAGLSEAGGGLLITAGLLGPLGPALVLAVMTVAAVTVHLRNGFFFTSNGVEVNLLYAAAAVAVGLAGPGRLSLDAVLGLHWSAAVVWATLLAGIIGGLAHVAFRRGPTPKES